MNLVLPFKAGKGERSIDVAQRRLKRVRIQSSLRDQTGLRTWSRRWNAGLNSSRRYASKTL